MTPTPPNPPPSPGDAPKNLLGRLTNVARQVSRIHFAQLQLDPKARPPKMAVYEPGRSPQTYPLLGDYYLIGRASRENDITVNSTIASARHGALRRLPEWHGGWLGQRYVFEDSGSTNGSYAGKRRVQGAVLVDRDVITLGPPDLADAVRLQYLAPPPWYVQAARYGLTAIAGVTALVGLWTLWEWQKIQILPLPQAARGPVVVQAGDGQILQQPLTTTHRELRSLSDFSPYAAKALIASEDARFYWHFGIDPIGTARAVLINVRAGAVQQGGSTLTQQLARTLYRDYVGSDDSAGRKLREAIVALKLETYYSKDRLLLAYLNQVFLGGSLAGFEDAAQFYFLKSAKDLTAGEAAMLVGILPAPNAWNPARSYQLAVQRRNVVLQRMLEQGAISLQEFNEARRSRIEINPKAKEILKNTKAPYFFNYVFQELEQLLGASVAREGNFLIQTHLDLRLQLAAERVLRQEIENQGGQFGFSQGAIVAIDPRNGAITALTGGKDFEESQYNRAAQAQRQPGSTFKAFTYAAALEKGISPSTTYTCNPVNWLGQKFKGCLSGSSPLDLFSAIARSENPIALRLAEAVGLDTVIETARKMGITTKLRKSPGLVLGDSEVTVLEMTGAYATLANGGRFNPPHAIARVFDTSTCTDFSNLQTCRLVYDFSKDARGLNEPVLTSAVATTMTQLLRGVTNGGTGSAANTIPGTVGKTGTTDRGVDLWFIGYVPGRNFVSGIWLGNDDNQPTRGSSAQAAALWGRYAAEALR